ncbi:Putative Topoisomerase I (Poxviridae) [Pacmanvirus A23]|uniref:Putative Topoisomerase I (Poxviridae) n=1 Tax=Pacmanvirus A23 TaxID=1932881 RepID=UPI000A095426|nr:Putative Topoisomerase I (Poxviridae) [Pacmanvirus A23]SIP85782.1 Putative Topoisomerase I (Poxviridae) [Pacmanvirus A23]
MSSFDVDKNYTALKAKILEAFTDPGSTGKEHLADLLAYMLCDFEIPQGDVLQYATRQVLEIENNNIDTIEAQKLEIKTLKRKYEKSKRALTKKSDVVTSLEDQNEGLEKTIKRVKRDNKKLSAKNKELKSQAELALF